MYARMKLMHIYPVEHVCAEREAICIHADLASLPAESATISHQTLSEQKALSDYLIARLSEPVMLRQITQSSIAGPRDCRERDEAGSSPTQLTATEPSSLPEAEVSLGARLHHPVPLLNPPLSIWPPTGDSRVQVVHLWAHDSLNARGL